jgi:hypothetical protein
MFSNITFVTSWFKIYDYIIENRTIEWRLEHFKSILKTGIQLCIYISPDYYDEIDTLSKEYTNLKIMKVMNLNETKMYKYCEKFKNNLPEIKNLLKDTFEYMVINHCKIEFVADVVEKNPYNSTHFSWIDFNIAYIFKDLNESLNYLKYISCLTFKDKIFLIPGCYKEKLTKDYPIQEHPYWRFCGGFFLADKFSIKELNEIYYDSLSEFLKEKECLVWEINLWAWIEIHKNWTPKWYDSDHNDSILHIPSENYIECLNNKLKKVYYNYPNINENEIQYLNSSASYIYFQGKHILNTRFVNYSYTDEGLYSIRDKYNILHTKNVYSILNEDTFIPNEYKEMMDSSIELNSTNCYSHGLEDIRLFEYNGKICFISTNVNYSTNGKNRMLIGEYNIEKLSYDNCKVLEPPTDTYCEKNWIPIIKTIANGGDHNENNNDDNNKKREELYFIYSWSPMQIGKIGEDGKTLEIVQQYEISKPIFKKVRGSSVFIDDGDTLLGIVHFSEEMKPRHYFHMFVRLEKDTFKPISYSKPFCFQHYGVEFCLGFTMKKDEYIFWISKKDNDTVMVSINKNEIPICNNI